MMNDPVWTNIGGSRCAEAAPDRACSSRSPSADPDRSAQPMGQDPGQKRRRVELPAPSATTGNIERRSGGQTGMADLCGMAGRSRCPRGCRQCWFKTGSFHHGMPSPLRLLEAPASPQPWPVAPCRRFWLSGWAPARRRPFPLSADSAVMVLAHQPLFSASRASQGVGRHCPSTTCRRDPPLCRHVPRPPMRPRAANPAPPFCRTSYSGTRVRRRPELRSRENLVGEKSDLRACFRPWVRQESGHPQPRGRPSPKPNFTLAPSATSAGPRLDGLTKYAGPPAEEWRGTCSRHPAPAACHPWWPAAPKPCR